MAAPALPGRAAAEVFMLTLHVAIPAESVKHLLDLSGNIHMAFMAVHAEVLPGVVDKVVMAENAINVRMILVVESHWQHGGVRNLVLTQMPQ
jgi:hypothetical protein